MVLYACSSRFYREKWETMELNGTYRGFSPTDESGVCLGELEVVVSDETVDFRFATGLTIESESMPRALFRRLATEDIAGLYKEGTDIKGIVGYRVGEDGAIFLISKAHDTPEAPQVLVLNFISEEIDVIFGYTYLYTPDQVKAGHFDRAVVTIETEQGDPGVLPRLENGGRRIG
jgi:hypothetical protein